MKARFTLYYILLCFCFCFASLLVAQKGLTGIPNLPPEEVRMMAEWEEVEGIVLAWPSSTPHRKIVSLIARYAAQECIVYILSGDVLSTTFTLQFYGVDMSQVTILTLGYDSIWTRDYGPWTVYQNKVSTRGISDFLYNRPLRTEDDQVPYEVADYMEIPLFNADENPYQWTHSGGNFLRDGLGVAYSSDLVLRENSGKTGLDLANFAKVFFGVSDYRIVNRLRYDTIHHLDMHMRILDEETIAVGYYPEGVADGPWIESNLDYIKNNYRTPYGRPYRIMRLEMPPHFGLYPPLGNYRTYTNSVFINKTILVPTYETAFDTTALRQYREYFPGYRVIGINCNEIIDELGALHCVTKLVGVEQPLWIAHPRIRDSYETGENLMIEAWAYHETGIANVQLYYRLNGDIQYQSIDMQVDPNDLSRWIAAIPPQLAGIEIEYYIRATANNGKQQLRPQSAPAGYYPFRVKAWSVPPIASWVQRKTEIAANAQVLFTNDSQHGSTSLFWSFPGGEPAFSTDESVLVNYPESGTYPVRLIAVNPVGRDTLLQTEAVVVKPTYLPFREKFNTPPGDQLNIVNPDSENVGWEWSTGPGCAGGYMQVAHRDADNKLNREYLRTAIDLRNFTQTLLTFDVAYAQRNAFHFDELRVNLIDQEGSRHNVYNKGGDVLATAAGAVPNFVPFACDDWRTDTIDLGRWEGQQLLFEIESIGDRGNTIYLDNLNFQANARPEAIITYPADQTVFIGNGQPLEESVSVDASDMDGEIASVEFYLGSDYLGEVNQFPYEMTYTLPAWGYYQLQARATDDEGAEVWAIPVDISYDFDSSSDHLNSLPIDVQLGPNPSRDKAVLRINSPNTYWGMEMTIIDAYGRQLRQWSEDIEGGENSFSLNLAAFPSGTYWLRLAHGKQELKLRWVKG